MLSQEIISNFIGRSRELKIFKQWLTDSDAPWILYFYDAIEEKSKKGGIGKTWLLKQCAMLARQRQPDIAIVMIDFFDIAYRDGVAIAEHIVKELETKYPQWSAKSFTKLLKEYHIANSAESVEGTDLRIDLAKALRNDLSTLDRNLAKTKKSLLVFFDTFELVEQNPSVAVLGLAQTFPDRYQFERIGVVIASRNNLDWTHPNWLGRERETQCVAMAPFSQQEMIEYLSMQSVYDIQAHPTEAQALYGLTEGRPILLGLVADLLNNRVMTIESLVNIPPHTEFEPNLVIQINELENPLNWVILFMAHAYHRFNATVLDWILSESSLKDLVQDISHQDLMTRLPTLSFVRGSGTANDLVLHDEMRRLVTKYCWQIHDPDEVYRKEISRCIISHNEGEIEQSQSEALRQAYVVETLHHTLFLDVNAGLQYFGQHFDRAILISKNTFARVLLQETRQFEDALSIEQRWNVQRLEAKLLRMEQNPLEALAVYQKLEDQADPSWIEPYSASILLEKGRCCNLHSNFSEAITCFTEGLKIVRTQNDQEQAAVMLRWLGYTYRSQGQFDDAKHYYEEGFALYKQLDDQSAYAATLNNLSYIDMLQGKTQEALRRCRIGLRIREELFRSGKGSEFDVALSLSTLGQIYLDAGHHVWADKRFKEAFEVYSRIGRRKEIAATYNRFGHIQMSRGDFPSAEQWFIKGQEASADINVEAHITSLSKQGQLLIKQEKWEEAQPLFEQAVTTAKQIHHEYQEAENLVYLADTLAHLEQEQQANKLLEEAEAISNVRNYYDVLAYAQEARGDIFYELADYKRAFKHYQVYCRFVAMRSEVEYNKALHQVIDKFFDVPKSELPVIMNEFVAYWVDQGLDKDYPTLMDTIQEVKRALFLEEEPS
ncbi:MAG TPA: tetratricopeptide repeat protein [Ktedonobacteraceae bacterium]|jgi:tetratricopeptide (TPR) repeat protein